jgi:integrase
MADVYDRWHKSRPGKDEPECPEHDGKVASSEHGCGKRWQARWRDEAGQQRKENFAKKSDADRRATNVGADLSRGAYVDPRAGRITVAEYARRWAATRPHKRRSARRLESHITNHLDGTTLGARPLAAVRPSEAQAWVTDRSRVLAPSTLRNLVSWVRSVYAGAVADQLVASSPFAKGKVALPTTHRPRIVPLTVAQVAALADAMPARNRAMVLVQAGLGLRIGELLALRQQDVNFLGRAVSVATQMDPDERVRIDPKTPLSKRTVPLPVVVAEALAEHIRQFPPVEDGTLFHTRFGKPYRHDYYGSRIFGKAGAAAGLPAGTTPHDLRHHYASVLVAAGESVFAVAERLGHSDATLVLKTYGHLMPDSEDATRRAIDAAWSALAVPDDRGEEVT